MTTLRILGTTLDESDYFIDCTVTNVTVDGTVELEENGVESPRTWTTDIETITEWRSGNEAVDHANLTDPSHTLWTTLKTLYSARNDPAISEVATAVGTNAERLFEAVVEAKTD